ncbi:MAG TPA: hypothetical protein VM368_00035 [Flavisolibacter sp.]|nr:hypothetical protein [Flavisolibacter sp.]
MRTHLLLLFIIITITACQKNIDLSGLSGSNSSAFIKYTIKKGQHYSDKSNYQSIEGNEVIFDVKFDSSAKYNTKLSENQYDINKLYGFSDNNATHQQYSARIGWRWSDGALRLFGYVYNNGVRASAEISQVPIGTQIRCSIKATTGNYIFTVNDRVINLPRLSTLSTVKGYKLYPYFGGDEPAPHDINIWIKEVSAK